MNLTPASEPLVAESIKQALAAFAPEDLVGISCIARGADSVFAQVIIEMGAALEVVLPSSDYRQAKVKPDHARLFDSLVARAAKVHTLPHATANRAAYEGANEYMLSSCDELVAVWDGQQGVDKGSTAAVVTQARERGIPVTVIWPEGASRDA